MIIFDHRYIFIVVDCGSKMVWTFPVQSTNGKEVVASLKTLFKMENNKPKAAGHDNGAAFVSEYTKNFLKKEGVESRPGRPGHPETQGQAESAVKIVKMQLTSGIMEEIAQGEITPGTGFNWTRILKKQTAILQSTPKQNWSGVSPYQVHTGKKNLMLETLNEEHAKVLESEQVQEVSEVVIVVD